MLLLCSNNTLLITLLAAAQQCVLVEKTLATMIKGQAKQTNLLPLTTLMQLMELYVYLVIQ
jgi:hypothetical protein